jgi:cell division protease FtsH
MRYSTFLQQVRAGKVAQASVSPTEIRYSLKPASDSGTPSSAPQASTDSKVHTTIPVESDLDLVKLLEEQRVEFGAPPPNRGGFLVNLLGWVIPPLIFLAYGVG